MVPDIELSILQNGTIKNAHLRDFKGKALILDTWATYCTPCVGDMPEVYKLSRKFDDDVNILYVGYEGETKINHFFNMMSKRSHPNAELLKAGESASFIANASSDFKKAFPAKTLGTKFWIDKDLKLRYITSDQITSEDIESFLAGRNTELTKITVPTISASDWVTKTIGYSEHLKAYSFFSKIDETINVSQANRISKIVDSSLNQVSVNAINVSIPSLYGMAYWSKRIPVSMWVDPNSIIVEGEQTKGYFQDGYEMRDMKVFKEWERENLYCYALKMPLADSVTIRNKIIADLDLYLNITSKLEKRKVKCYVFRKIAGVKSNILASKGGKEDGYEYKDKVGNTRNLFKNEDLSQLHAVIFSRYFIDRKRRTLFLNELEDIKVDVDIQIGMDNWSIESLNKELKKYGLVIAEEERERNVVVLREN